MHIKCESHQSKADTAELHLRLGAGADPFGLPSMDMLPLLIRNHSVTGSAPF